MTTTTDTIRDEYTPVVMTHEGEPVAAIVDYAAFALLADLFDQVQQARNAGELPTPRAWRTMMLEMIYGGFTHHQEVTA